MAATIIEMDDRCNIRGRWVNVDARQSGTIARTGRNLAAGLAIAIAAIGLAMSFAVVGPSYAWADADAGLQGATLEALSSADYYAVLHKDGSLVFQAEPSRESGVTNFAGSCAPYASGKAPWLAKSALITSVRFDESFANIKPESLAFWFIGCSNLKSIDLQNLDASASTSMRSMFSGCSSLTTIEHLSSFDTSSSTYFGSMFRDCSSLTSLDVSHFDATHVGVLCFMFAGCTKLEALNMAGEGWRTSSLYLMVHVWENCSSLKSLDLSYLDTSGVHSMAKDFNGCSSLEYLDLSGADTSQVGSLDALFNGCSKLTTVKLGPKFTFNGMAKAPQCSLPRGMWQSSATGAVYASADVPNNTAATYTRIADEDGDDPTTGPVDNPDNSIGEYAVPNLKSSLGMFNHFVEGSQKLTIAEAKVTLAFTTDGSIEVVRNITKVAIGPSSKLANAADMKEGETKYANSLLGNPAVFEGTLVSSAGNPKQYAYELEFAKTEFFQMIAKDGGIYLTLFHGGKNAWHKGDNDLLLTLGAIDGLDLDGNTPDKPGTDVPDPSDAGESGEVVDLSAIEDGTYSVELTVDPSMIKLAGHGGKAPEPRVVVKGDEAWLVVSYRSTGNSAWRYAQMAWGSYEEVVAAHKDGFGGAPTFKEGKCAVDGMSDQTLDAMTFALPLRKSDLVQLLVSGEAQAFTVRYVRGYSGEHDGDWWKPTSQSTLTLANLRVASEPASVPADYAAVLDALADVPANLDIYTEASAGDLKRALANVAGSPKSVAEQGEVDATAKAIAAAVKALETKEAAAKAAAEKAAAEKAAAKKAAAEEREAAAKKVTTVVVNVKTVNAKAIASAISKAKGKAKYVKTITLGKKVQNIAKAAFKYTKATTVVVKTAKLSKKSVTGSLKSSKVKTVKVKVGKAKVNKKYAAKYKKYFTKKNAGKSVKVSY